MACASAWQYDSFQGSRSDVHDAGWQGVLELRYEMRAGRSVLAERRHRGPLLVQKPFYPEGDAVCHGIVLHPPGGIVGGDRLELRVQVQVGAAALLTTPGAGKWYRSAGRTAQQRLVFDVADGASLEWLPQPTIVFDRALVHCETEVELGEHGRFIGWDILCLGRTAAHERLRAGRMTSSIRMTRNGRPLWLERACIDGGSRLLDSPVGLAGQPVCGTLLAAAPEVDAAMLARGRTVTADEGRVGLTRLPGMLVARYLGPSSAAAQSYFTRLWTLLRPALLAREACPPRIWRT